MFQYSIFSSLYVFLGLPSVVEERIISSLSHASLTDELIPSESKSDDRSKLSTSMDTSSQTDQDVLQDSKPDVLALVTSEQAVCHSKTVFEEPESPSHNTEDLNEKGVHETREENMKTSQRESEDETSADLLRSEPSTMITDLVNSGGGGAEEIPVGSSGQMLKVIVPKHLLPAVKQISLPSVLLSHCSGSEPVPLK